MTKEQQRHRGFCVAAVGLGQWELDSLSATIALAAGSDIAQWRLEPDPAQASVVIAGDANRAGRAWLERTTAPGSADLPVVVACIERNVGAVPTPPKVLYRPVAYTELVALLRGLEAVLRDGAAPQSSSLPIAVSPTAPLEAAPPYAPALAELPVIADAVIAEPVIAEPEPPPVSQVNLPATQRPRAVGHYFDGTRLIGLLRRVLTSGVATELRHPRFPLLTVYPGSWTYTLEVDAASLPDMFRSSSLEFSVGRKQHAFIAPQQRLERQPLTRLLFCAARYGAEGKLPEGVEVDDVYQISAGLDLSVVPLDVADQQILLHLAQGPADLNALVEASGLDYATVIDVVGACEAVNFVQRRPRGSLPATPQESGTSDSGVRKGLTATMEQLRLLANSVLSRSGEG